MQTVDYLIVGQGLAGTLLGHFLEQAQQSILFIDNHHKGAASKVAAGIINPVTGRRFVKSWDIDRFFPFAKTTYQNIENLLDIECWTDQQIVRALSSPGEENTWLSRSSFPEIQPYVIAQADEDTLKSRVVPPVSWMELKGGAQVKIDELIYSYSTYWKAKGAIIQAPFNYEKLKLTHDGVSYDEIKAKRIIFCEGHQGRFNPWFSNLPFEVSKGEVLQLHIPDLEYSKLLKYKLMMAPLGEHLYWWGSNYGWQPADDLPTSEGKKALLDAAAKVFDTPFTVKQHLAAIRPTVKDRRPFLGVHARHAQILIFNGLGTKGASLGPYWANEMKEFIINKQPINPQVDIKRFE